MGYFLGEEPPLRQLMDSAICYYYAMQTIDKKKISVYKKGQEPSDVLYWLSRPPIERIIAMEQIRESYNQWKYGTQQGFQRVYRVVKRERG